MKRTVFYIAMLSIGIYFFLYIVYTSFGCKGKEKSILTQDGNCYEQGGNAYSTDTNYINPYAEGDTNVIIKDGEGFLFDTTIIYDLIVSDSLGEIVATKKEGKWVITNCEKALQVMLENQNYLGKRYDELIKKLYKKYEAETPIGISFANNKN